ncbi:MAG: alpha/beta hydrolase [Syntrophomonadaceae bacterium]|nr:alpha/beta hydrolase [Syntrophomonadaceae bacterium]
MFKEQLQQIMVQHRDYNKIHLVGYSMGGLVIRSFLACNDIPQLGRCVLIATPNQGTKLADISEKYLKPLVLIVRPLQVLTTNCLNIGQPMNQSKIEIGVIAGNKNNHPLGVFLTPDSDGLVEVESTKYTDMSDFIIVPYGHLEIHRQTATAQLVHRFLQTGSFRNLNNE